MRNPILVTCFLLLFFPIIGSAEDNSSTFTLSSSSSTTVLKSSFSGGLVNERREFELFGDGRLIRTTFTGDKSRSTEVTLAHIEMRDLIQILIDANCINWSRESLARRFKEDIGSVPSAPHDGVTVHIMFSLESYGDQGQLTKEFSYSWSPGMVKIEVPSVTLPEVHGLVAFWKKLLGYFQKKNKVQA